jgi:hypothetical protein
VSATESAAFTARADEWNRAGLPDTQDNANKIINWLGNKPCTVANLDAAVHALGNQLAWKTETPAEPARLPNGELELAIDADDYAQKHASVIQLKDLVARRRKVSGQQFTRRAGSFSAKF